MGKGASDDFNTVIMIITQVYDCQLNNSCGFFSGWWKYMLVYICGKYFLQFCQEQGNEQNWIALKIILFNYLLTLILDMIIPWMLMRSFITFIEICFESSMQL